MKHHVHRHQPIAVFIVDDHPVVRDGIRLMLTTIPGFNVVGEAATAAEAKRAIIPADPDVVIVDAKLPDGSGTAIVRDVRARRPDIRCLILTSFPDEQGFYDAVSSGAKGYVSKDVSSSEIVSAIRQVADGRSVLRWDRLSGGMLDLLQMPHPQTKRDPLEELTDQETKIIELLSEGMTNREISDCLYLAEKTVRNYVSNILSKLEMKNRTQAAAYMVRRRAREHVNATTSDGRGG